MAYPQHDCMPHPHAGIDFHPFLGIMNVWLRGHVAVATLLLCALYSFFVLRAVKPGLPRLLLGLPVLAGIHAVPLLFHPVLEPLATISATFLAVRLTSGKVLAFILGRGVLLLPLSLPQFASVMLAPFMPAQMMTQQLAQHKPKTAAPAAAADQRDAAAAQVPKPVQLLASAWQQVTPTQRYSIDVKPSSRPPSPAAAAAATARPAPAKQSATSAAGTSAAPSPQRRHTANLLLNAAVAAAFIAYTCSSRQRFVCSLLHLGSLGLMWRCMELLMMGASVPARDWLGMTLAPHFRNPYAATSLTDFWARRWNITQGLVLRFFVYEPIVEGRLLAAAAGAGPAAAGLKAAAAAEVAAQQQHATAHQAQPAQPLADHEQAATVAPGAAGGGTNWPAGLRHRGSSRPPQVPTGAAEPLAAALPAAGSRSDLNNAADDDDCSSSSLGLADTASSNSQVAEQQQQLQPNLTQRQQNAAGTAAVSGTAAALGRSASQPLLARSSTTFAPRWRRQLAAGATFFVSGLEHELFMAYATRGWGWRWLAFFSLQGLLLAGEGGVKRRAAAAGLVLHPAVASLGVLLALGVTADSLFWPVLVQPALVQPLLAAMPGWVLQAVGAAPWCSGP